MATDDLPQRPAHVQLAEVDGEAVYVGRDPRTMSEAELGAVGHHKRRLLDVVRDGCIACAGGNQAEVRRCRLVECVFWPYRMGASPFATREMSDEQRAAAADRLRAARELRRK